jgi:hypothetical protein
MGVGASLLREMACLGKARQAGPQVSAMVRQIILAGFVVFLPTGVRAQGRGMMPPVSHAVAVAPRMVMQVPHSGTAMAMPGARIVVRGGTARPRMPGVRITSGPASTRRRLVVGETNFRADCNSAPGLGFDAVHQAATCGPGRAGGRRSALQVPLFFPFFGSGFFLPGSTVALEESSAEEVSQQEAAEVEAREYARRRRASQLAQAAPVTPVREVEPDAATLRDSEEFVFVRRDGTLFFAVAYAWENGTLRYVNSQGLRQTVKQEALDLSATQQFNELRGLNFHLPA